MKVSIDLGRCTGYANCVVAAPEVLDLDEVTGKAFVILENPGPELAAAVDEAVLSCPVEAVLVERDG